jgi:hypothetical protein
LCWIRCASADTLDGEAEELDIFSPRCVPARRCFSPLTDSGIFLLLLHSLAAPPVRSPRFGGACTAHPSVRPSERTIDFNKEKGRETNERSTTTARRQNTRGARAETSRDGHSLTQAEPARLRRRDRVDRRDAPAVWRAPVPGRWGPRFSIGRLCRSSVVLGASRTNKHCNAHFAVVVARRGVGWVRGGLHPHALGRWRDVGPEPGADHRSFWLSFVRHQGIHRNSGNEFISSSLGSDHHQPKYPDEVWSLEDPSVYFETSHPCCVPARTNDFPGPVGRMEGDPAEDKLDCDFVFGDS